MGDFVLMAMILIGEIVETGVEVDSVGDLVEVAAYVVDCVLM